MGIASQLKERVQALYKGEGMDDRVVVLQHSPIYTLGTESCCNFLNTDFKNLPFELHQLVDYEGEICGFVCLFCFLVCVALFYEKFQRHTTCKDFHGEHKHTQVSENCCHIIHFFAFQNFGKMCISNSMTIL